MTRLGAKPQKLQTMLWRHYVRIPPHWRNLSTGWHSFLASKSHCASDTKPFHIFCVLRFLNHILLTPRNTDLEVMRQGMAKLKQKPILLPGAEKTALRTQFGALCYRFQRDKVQVLLVTSRTNKRWIVPKGWPVDGTTPVEAALREAHEEAGVEGKVSGNCIGIYSYVKEITDQNQLPCVVAIYPVKVTRLLNNYAEKAERKRKWFSLKKAAAAIDELELRQIVKDYDPRIGS